MTYAHRFLEAARRFGAAPALRWKADGAWRDMSFADLGARVRDCAAALARRGVEPGDRVAIWHETSREWVIADLGAQVAGAVTATVYHTLLPAQAAAIVRDAGAKALVASRRRLESLGAEGILGTLVTVAIATEDFWTLLDEGRAARGTAEAAPPVRPEDLSAIVYTSGTTGEPKGAMLTHASVLVNAEAGIEAFMPRGGHTALLHLPLAHVMGRNTVTPVTLLSGSTLALAEPEREKLPSNLVEVAPTGFMTVPYLLDKFMGRVLEMLGSKGPLMRALARRALALGRRRRVAALERRRRAGPIFAGPRLALLDRLVLRKIRARLGGRLQWIVIGGSNSNRESVEFFWGLGIAIYEGYGATEVTNSATFCRPGAVKLGTVGRAACGGEVRLAEDGEVLVRGPQVMRGYWNRPEATREAIDAQGWYHTGDIGALDEEGYLRIVDRKKEIFALSTGKKVAPQAVENALKLSPLVANACAIGDRRRFMTALVVPDLEVARARLGLEAPPAADDPRVADLVRGEVERVAGALADFERPKRLRVLAEPFGQENDLLTPTLKLKRRRIAERFAKEIEALYADAKSPETPVVELR